MGEFRRLALLAEADGHLRQKLQQVLKLSKEKWDDARDHALRAVVADNRMRIWYADKASMELGLLFSCRLGNVDLERPVGARAKRLPALCIQGTNAAHLWLLYNRNFAYFIFGLWPQCVCMSIVRCDRAGQPDTRRRRAGLLQKKSQEGTQTTMEATLMAQQTPGQREQVLARNQALMTCPCGTPCDVHLCQRGVLWCAMACSAHVPCSAKKRNTRITSAVRSSPKRSGCLMA